MIKVSLIKQGGVLTPATQADQEQLGKYRNGEVVNGKLTGKSLRSYKFHKLYFGGLLSLAMDYWQPRGGILTKEERDFAKGVVSFVESQGFDSEAVKGILRAYMEKVIAERQSRIETQHKSIEGLHHYIKIEAGYYDAVMTPDGIIKEAKSISFDSMTPEDFKEFYKRAFNVAWNMILSKSFKDKEEANNAISQLLSMSN